MFNILPIKIYGRLSEFLPNPVVWSLIINIDNVTEFHVIGYYTNDWCGYLQSDDLYVLFKDINYIDFYIDIMAEKLRRKGFWDAFCN